MRNSLFALLMIPVLLAGCGKDDPVGKTPVELCTNQLDDDNDGRPDCEDADCDTNVACSLAGCGDAVKAAGETCDGGDLGGQTCATQGFAGGLLRCASNCRAFDTSACTTTNTCGNGSINAGETCDGAQLGGATCVSQGFSGGTLGCRADCSGFVTTGCVAAQTCSNGTREGSEVCDGADLAGQTCMSRGFSGGALACASNCAAFDTTACTGSANCGNGAIDGGEVCDGNQLGGQSCQSLGYRAGTLTCTASCTSFNVNGCTGFAGCGDGALDGLEACDGAAYGLPYGPSCADFNLGTGTVTCGTECRPNFAGCQTRDICTANDWYDDGYCDACQLLGGTTDPDCVTLCAADGTCADVFDVYTGVYTCRSTGRIDPDCGSCGNGVLDSGELCDGSQFHASFGATCGDWGFVSGTLGCRADCTPNFAQCVAPVCGDGQIQGYESCDGMNHDGYTCGELGYSGGNLTCSSDCLRLSYASCTGVSGCGDGTVNGVEICDPAGSTAFGSMSCAAFSLGTGNVTCTSDCKVNVSTCQQWECLNNQGQPCAAGSGNCTCQARAADMCRLFGWYDDDVCDPCDRLGGTVDPDCAQHCGAEGTCADYYSSYAGVFTCRDRGVLDPDCGVCGDGVVEGSELCDPGVASGDFDTICQDYGFAGGSLGCRSDCLPNFDGCVEAVCGNGTVDPGELCDGNNVASESCATQGFQTGTLTCRADCKAFVVSQCRGNATCGNGRLDPFEACDGTRFAQRSGADGALCATWNLGTGTVACTSSCTLNYAACELSDRCARELTSPGVDWYGDGVCDNCDLYAGGSVDTADCNATVCGALDGQCWDYFDPATQQYTCSRFGFRDPDCGYCGNTAVEGTEVPAYGEYCDPRRDGPIGFTCADAYDCSIFADQTSCQLHSYCSWSNNTCTNPGGSSGTIECRWDCIPNLTGCSP